MASVQSDDRASACLEPGASETAPRRHGAKKMVARVAGLTAARLVGTLCNGIALILVARWIGPAEFGQFSVALSILMTVAGVLGLGLPVFALRAAVLRRVPATGYASFLNLLTSLIAAALGLLIVASTTTMPVWALAFLATSVAVEKNAELRVGLGTEFGQARLVNWTLTLRGLLVLGAVGGAHALGASALTGLIVGRLAAMSAAAIILTLYVKGWPMTATRPRDGSLEVMGSLAAENSIAAARQLDVTLVGAAAGPVGAGLYAGVQKILMPITLLTGSLRVVVMGPIARGGIDRAKKGAHACFLAALAAALVLGVASIWSEPLVTLVLGNEFTDAADAFRWLLIGIPAIAINPLVITILQDKGRAAWVTWSTGIATAATLGGVVAGGALAGAGGATLAFALVAWLRLGSLVVMTRTLGRGAESTEP